MFVNSDGTVDTEALMEFNNESEDRATTASRPEVAEAEEPESESEVEELEAKAEESEESPAEDQMTFDQFSDGVTGVLQPAFIPVLAGLAANRLMLRRIQRELKALTSKPGASLRPSRERIAKGATAYSLFVGLVAFNLLSLGLIPG